MNTHRFDRLPATAADRTDEERVTRTEVIDFFADRYGIPPETWDGYTFWEKGADKVWAYAGDLPDPVDTESLGMTVLRTGGEHWKPTTDAAQRFGPLATENVLVLPEPEARTFLAGEDLEPAWDGDWGYLFVAHELAGERAVIGVGLYVYDELRSVVPKGRRREFTAP